MAASLERGRREPLSPVGNPFAISKTSLLRCAENSQSYRSYLVSVDIAYCLHQQLTARTPSSRLASFAFDSSNDRPPCPASEMLRLTLCTPSFGHRTRYRRLIERVCEYSIKAYSAHLKRSGWFTSVYVALCWRECSLDVAHGGAAHAQRTSKDDTLQYPKTYKFS